jgi:nitrous oxidase accessory protein NosD
VHHLNPSTLFLTLSGRTGKCNWKDQHCCAIPDKYKYSSPSDTNNYYGYGRTIYVKPNQKMKIQDAIKRAHPGDRIIVEAGEYPEQLVIDKDGIQLEARGEVRLVKPHKYKRNACTGLTQDEKKNELQAGICITGYKVETTEYKTEHKRVTSVKRPVKGVSVTGFSVSGFSGINIAIIGAKNTRITKNKLTDAPAYGALTLGSVNTVFRENVVTTTAGGFIGICQDNLSDVQTVKNDISAHLIGVCVQTNSAFIGYNTLHDNCIGIFVDPGVKDAKIVHNYVGPTPAACGKTSSGIILGSAVGTLVRDNTIEGQRGSGTGGAGAGVGILIYDDACVATSEQPISLSCITLGGKAPKANHNIVIQNTLKNNDNDILNLSKGAGNVIKCNTCENSVNIQAGQCKKP